MAKAKRLAQAIQSYLGGKVSSCKVVNHQVIVEVASDQLRDVCTTLRDHERLTFDMLMDISGVDYSQFGVAEWDTQTTTYTGYCRGVTEDNNPVSDSNARFAVVYQLLSTKHNWRLILRTFALGEPPMVESLIDIWPSANWNEREAFDLFGIYFNKHPDLRRILTDYGFIGHPFRKDFPLSGEVEVRYDAKQQRVINEPVNIEPRVLVPKVIRAEKRAIEMQEGDDGRDS